MSYPQKNKGVGVLTRGNDDLLWYSAAANKSVSAILMKALTFVLPSEGFCDSLTWHQLPNYVSTGIWTMQDSECLLKKKITVLFHLTRGPHSPSHPRARCYLFRKGRKRHLFCPCGVG